MGKDVSIWVRLRDGFSNSLKRAGARFKSFASDVVLSGKGIAIMFAAITAAVVKSVRQFDEFNKQMARVEGLLGGVKATQLRAEIRGLSAEIGTAKRELVDGLYNALSAGIPENNVISFLRSSAKAAAVDGSDLAVVVDGVTTVINAFNLEATDGEKAANAMFGAVAKGKTTMGELSASLAQVAPNAAAARVSFTEIFAALANATSQGTKTSVAVTQLRAALDGANKVLGDGWSATMTLNEAFAELRRRANGSQNELKTLLGTNEAVAAVLAATGDNADKAAAAFASLSEESADLSAIFEGTTKDALAFDRLFNALGNTMLIFGEHNTNKVVPSVDKLAASIQDFNESAGKSPEFLDRMTKAAGNLLSGGLARLPHTLALAVKEMTDLRKEAENAPDPEAAAGPVARPTNAVEEILKDIEVIQARNEAAAKKKAEAERVYANEIQRIETELQAAKQAARDQEVNDFLEAEERKADIAKQKAQERKDAELEALRKVVDERANALDKAARNALFKDLGPTFSQRFNQFKQDRQARRDAEKEDERIQRRVEKLREKQARGTRLNKSDQQFLADIKEFRDREKAAKALQEKANKMREKIARLLEENLKASGGPA